MNSLLQHHQTELLASSIAPEIIALNFESLTEEESPEALLYAVSRKNDGRVSDKHTHYQNLGSGWWCTGIDLATGDRMDWGCFKPDEPRTDKAKGKPIKYEHPPATRTEYFALAVSFGLGAKIAARYGLADEYADRQRQSSAEAEDIGFWSWAIEQKAITLFLAEGAKKAACLLSMGYLVIGLPGIWGGHRNGKAEGLPSGLIPALRSIVEGREVLVVFDQDSNPKTAREVGRAANTTLRDCREAGANPTGRIAWDLFEHPHKGIDDLVVAEGAEIFDRLVQEFGDRRTAANGSEKGEDRESTDRTHYESNPEEGLVFVTVKQNDDGSFSPSRVSIGNHLEAIAYIDNPDQDGAAILLEFGAVRGGLRRWTMPRAELAGDGGEICRGLLGRGYWFDRKQRNHLLRYLQGLGGSVEQTYVVTHKTGWHGSSYVTPHKTYGDETICFRDVEADKHALTEIRGTHRGWWDGVGLKCVGNSRLELALGVALSAPLIRLSPEFESGGIHIFGDSSEGKTTTAKVSTSVTGEKVIQTWNQTVSGLEGTAEAHNDALMILDELHQCADPKKVGTIAYQLANEEGKVRAKVTGDAKKSKNWKVGFLSTGEKSIVDYLRSNGITIKAGQEVRIPSIPASPKGALFGCFETTWGAESPERFAMDLEAAAAANRGTVGDIFLSRLVVDAQGGSFAPVMKKRIEEIANSLTTGIENNAVKRVAMKRFALYQYALELAIDYGIIPSTKESAAKSIRRCWQDWLDDRGGDGSRDVKEAVSKFFLTISRDLHSNRVYDPTNPHRSLMNTLGYRLRPGSRDEILCIPPSTFDAEFCGEVKRSALVKELVLLGALTQRADGRVTSQQIAEPGQQQKKYFFCVNLGSCCFSGDFGDFGDSRGQKQELERVLHPDKNGDSGDLLGDSGDSERSHPSLESPESHRENGCDSGVIFQNPARESDSSSESRESLESPKKQQLPVNELKKINEEEGDWDE
jgi:putative DNA primase/helicase